jgi:RHS repeat-associated protein
VKRYDANGNIRELERFGLISGPDTFGRIDNLIYTYSGNQLLKVTDIGSVAAGFADDSTPTGPEADYSFDANGNQIRDDNKQIAQIEYNYLNLPRRVTKTSGDYVIYQYDGTGRKLRQSVFNSSNTLTKQTDYAGDFVYEGNVLQFVNHPEGRVVKTGSSWQYQFFLKDHLGNVRMTIAPKTDVYAADFETGTNAAFRNYTRVSLDLFDHTDAGTAKTYSQRLTGAANSQVGIAKSLAVNAGDTIQVEVWAKYLGSSSGTGNLAGFATALLGAFGLAPPAVGETGTAASAMNSFGALVASGGNQGNANWPKGWLNVLVFDNAYNLVDLAFQQLDGAFVQPVGSATKEPHQRLCRQVVITKPGFVYIYVSNEGTVLQDIHFDDLKITHRQVQVIQEDAYYPFGMAHSSYSLPTALQNPYKYNGKELQDELNLGWLDYGARMYDNTIGRWGVVDPLAEVSRRWSPYAYCYNSPITFIDPDGMLGTTYGTMGVNYETGSVDTYNYAGGLEGDETDPSKEKTGKAMAKLSADVNNTEYGKYKKGVAIPSREDLDGWKLSDKDFGITLTDNKSGLNSAVYEKDGEYAYVTQGSDPDNGGVDWQEDTNQALGKFSQQYYQSTENAAKLELQLGNKLSFSGHSLGGANALKTGLSAITFNAAGLSKPSRLFYGLNQRANIDAYQVDGEIVGVTQAALGLRAEGRIHTLQSSLPYAPTYIPVPQLRTAAIIYNVGLSTYNHTMGAVMKAMGIQ